MRRFTYRTRRRSRVESDLPKPAAERYKDRSLLSWLLARECLLTVSFLAGSPVYLSMSNRPLQKRDSTTRRRRRSSSKRRRKKDKISKRHLNNRYKDTIVASTYVYSRKKNEIHFLSNEILKGGANLIRTLHRF